jgi:hypothetical protein
VVIDKKVLPISGLRIFCSARLRQGSLDNLVELRQFPVFEPEQCKRGADSRATAVHQL